MPAEEPSFRLFPQLPTELRLAVWRECIPRRVCELDVPAPEIVFSLAYGASSPCQLFIASRSNACPPLVSRICRESRRVAFETGRFCALEASQGSKWSSWNDWNSTQIWQDPDRDSVHLHWIPAYDVDFESDGDPLNYLQWHARATMGTCSLTEDFFTDGSSEVARNVSSSQESTIAVELAALRRLPECLVVLRVVIVHSELRDIASSGLFGLLGDAPVQIVDAADADKVDAFFALAQGSESDCQISVRQDFRHPTAEVAKRRLKDLLLAKYDAEDLARSMRPAYMFRLCTAFCNRVDRQAPAKPCGGRGRGQGRGQGRWRGY